MTARDEILAAARSLTARDLEPFSPSDLIAELHQLGSTYPESTLRTYIVSVMCVDAPRNHPVRYPDLERVGHGQYRLAPTAGEAAVTDATGTGRSSSRAQERDPELQLRILRAIADAGGRSSLPLDDLEGQRELGWQLDDLVKRAYLKRTTVDGDEHVVLTRAGHRAAIHGLPDVPTARRAALEPHELELLHQLMWDAAVEVPNETRRRLTGGIKWMLEEHFGVETADGAGPQGKPRKDAFSRLEGIGAIEQIGGGAAKRTSNCWVTDPGMVQYPW